MFKILTSSSIPTIFYLFVSISRRLLVYTDDYNTSLYYILNSRPLNSEHDFPSDFSRGHIFEMNFLFSTNNYMNVSHNDDSPPINILYISI